MFSMAIKIFSASTVIQIFLNSAFWELHQYEFAQNLWANDHSLRWNPLPEIKLKTL